MDRYHNRGIIPRGNYLMLSATLEDLLLIIGDKEVTIALLRKQVEVLQKQLADGSPSSSPALQL